MGRLAQQAHTEHQQSLASLTSAESAAALANLPSDAARPAQHTAAELVRQQLQLLTVDSQQAESALLTKLIRACVVTLGLMTSWSGGLAGGDTTWLPQGIVAGTLS